MGYTNENFEDLAKEISKKGSPVNAHLLMNFGSRTIPEEKQAVIHAALDRVLKSKAKRISPLLKEMAQRLKDGPSHR